MKGLTYLQNRTIYYSLFVSALLNRAPHEVYREIAPFFFTEENAVVEALLKNEQLSQLNSCAMLGIYMNYVKSFCVDEACFGKRTCERETLALKQHVLGIVEELRKSPTANVLAALCDAYDRGLSVVYALALYCSNPDAKKEYMNALRKAVRNADGLDACIALLHLEPQRKEWLDALHRNETVRFYPDVMALMERNYAIAP